MFSLRQLSLQLPRLLSGPSAGEMGVSARHGGTPIARMVSGSPHLSGSRVGLGPSTISGGRALFPRFWSSSAMQTQQTGPKAALTPTQKVVEGTKSAFSGLIALGGLGVAGVLIYYASGSLFSSQSPYHVFDMCLEKCRSHPEVIAALGQPIRGYGEGRRRSTMLAYNEYERHGIKCLLLQVHLEGPSGITGTCFVEMYHWGEGRKAEVNYMFVDIPSRRQRIWIEENYGSEREELPVDNSATAAPVAPSTA